MWGNTILDMAVGVVFGFLAISLLTSAAVEAINSIGTLRPRSRNARSATRAQRAGQGVEPVMATSGERASC